MDTTQIRLSELNAGWPAGKATVMTIEEAIKILEDILLHVAPGDPPEEHDAIKLGIEALRRIKERRDLETGWESQPLPGETDS